MYNITKKDLEVKFQEKSIIEDELENTILNYKDYENGYVDTIYQFIIDNGIFYVACNCEDEGLHLIIDYLEYKGLEGWFIKVKEEYEGYVIDGDDYIIDINNDKYHDHEYIIGGNHSRYLYHGGNFRIDKLDI